MELNFFYAKKGQYGKITLNAEELDYTVNYSSFSRYRPTAGDTSSYGWLPIENGGLKNTLPRFYGTISSKATYSTAQGRFTSEFISKVRKFDGHNVYALDRGANFIEKDQNNNYTGIDLYVQGENGKKKVCKMQWAVLEEDDPQHPGQKIPTSYFNGLYAFVCPSDDLPENSTVGTLSLLQAQQGKYSADAKIALWIITVHDDVSGSPTYGQDFKVLVEAFSQPTGFSTQGVIMADMRCLTGVDTPSNIINGSDPKKNSTPKGWSGQRNTRTSTDLPTQCPSAVVNSVNFGTYGLHLYECSNEAIDQLSGILFNKWVKHLFDDWEPVTGILSLHKLPYSPDSEMQPGLPDKDYPLIHLAGHDAKADGTSYDVFAPGGVFIPENVTTYEYECHGREILGGQTLESDVIEVQPFFGSFLDFEPYTKVQVRLPFIGIVSIPTSACMGGKLKVNYVLDNRNGNCVAQILCWSMRNSEIDSGDDSDNYMIVGQYSGNCAMPAAIAGNSTGGEVRMGIVRGFASSAVAMGAGVALGAVSGTVAMAGVIGSAANAAVNYGSVKETPTIVGSLNTEAACLHDLTVRVLITRPVDVTPGDFKFEDGERIFTASSLMDQKGLASYAGGTVGQYEGMTIGYIRGAIEGATEAEMTAIKNAFLGGVIV